ncbi:hypothetical protein ACYSNR_02680 [Enterococcus sp. LJL128]|uniref:hypothetical protein n=1 Tax=Enterococcus sp. LJL51 TaxID=3416656 RepID=UPI003CEA0B47
MSIAAYYAGHPLTVDDVVLKDKKTGDQVIKENISYEKVSGTVDDSPYDYPKDIDGNPIPLNKHGEVGNEIPLPDPLAEGRPHTILGGKASSKTGEVYRQLNLMDHG